AHCNHIFYDKKEAC
ncbi:unnamed protein product, partial [Leptidea sinapis]